MSKISEFPYTQVLIEQCPTCKICCNDHVYEGISGYNTINAIINKEIPDDLIKRLVIHRVPKSKIDKHAKSLLHFPKKNILKNLTKIENGYYEFLAFPDLNAKCIFCGDKGCAYPKVKCFDCVIFPFYFEDGKFLYYDWCPETKLVESDPKLGDYYYKQTLKSTNEYAKYSKKHKDQYFRDLKKIKEKYNLKVIEI